MNQQEKFFSYIKNEKGQIQEALQSGEKASEQAQKLLDAALDEWSDKNEGKGEEKCLWLKDSREFIAELEAMEKGELADIDAANEKLRVIAKNISIAARKELMAELPSVSPQQNKTPEQRAFEEAIANWKKHPFEGFFGVISTGIAYLFSDRGGLTPTAPDEAQKTQAKVEKKEAPKEIIDYPELKINLPSNAVLTSDIQSHREATGRPHNGIDVAGMKEGTPLYTPGVGKVVDVGTHKGFGNFVRIEYKIAGKFYEFRFNHLAEKSNLEKGALVGKGVELGKVGHTGFVIPGKNGQGDHLHFEVYNSKGALVDPLQFLPGRYQQALLVQREDSGKDDPRWSHDDGESALT